MKGHAVPTFLGLSGSVWQPSKARSLVELAVKQVATKTEITHSIADLSQIANEPLSYSRAQLGPQTRRLLEAIEQADALIVGMPVFQGSYPGLFKHIFDLLDPTALNDRPVLLTAIGGGTRHALAIEHQLRPLFGFFEANTMPTAVYLCSKDFDESGIQDAATAARLETATKQLALSLSSNKTRLTATQQLACIK